LIELRLSSIQSSSVLSKFNSTQFELPLPPKKHNMPNKLGHHHNHWHSGPVRVVCGLTVTLFDCNFAGSCGEWFHLHRRLCTSSIVTGSTESHHSRISRTRCSRPTGSL